MLITDSNTFIGNEEDFDFTLSIGVNTSSNNSDVNYANNEETISFELASEFDINVVM